MIEVIWPARFGCSHSRGGISFAPGQVEPFDSLDDVPEEIRNDGGFIIREVAFAVKRVDERLRPGYADAPAKAKVESEAKKRKKAED